MNLTANKGSTLQVPDMSIIIRIAEERNSVLVERWSSIYEDRFSSEKRRLNRDRGDQRVTKSIFL
jgi:hypothetical protein